jgi:hypothetical protein
MVKFSQNNGGRNALETAREYNLNVGVGGDNRKKENSDGLKNEMNIFSHVKI